MLIIIIPLSKITYRKIIIASTYLKCLPILSEYLSKTVYILNYVIMFQRIELIHAHHWSLNTALQCNFWFWHSHNLLALNIQEGKISCIPCTLFKLSGSQI